MKNLKVRSFALVAGTLMLAATAWAQLGTATKFEVPFSFEAAGQAMPAGEYSLVRNDRVASLRNFDHKLGILNVWEQADTARSQMARLVFLKTGNRYILKSGEIPGYVARWSISKQDVAMQAKADTQEVVILARR